MAKVWSWLKKPRDEKFLNSALPLCIAVKVAARSASASRSKSLP
jgi:hypothetical protein